jgi:hypothetical protein
MNSTGGFGSGTPDSLVNFISSELKRDMFDSFLIHSTEIRGQLERLSEGGVHDGFSLSD